MIDRTIQQATTKEKKALLITGDYAMTAQQKKNNCQYKFNQWTKKTKKTPLD